MNEKDKPTVPIAALDAHVTKPVVPVDPLVGHRVAGRYELLHRLAKGGFGKVYKARDTKLERIVAIKLVDFGKASDDMRVRMLREARANARLHHPNVVVLHDAGEDPFGLFLVLEYIAGTSLAEVLANGPLEPHRAAEITRDTAVALAAAHAHGIVHRDIKPANILLTESGQVKVADFGVARLVGEVRLTERGSIIGTPNYMAPEQIDGSEVGPQADLFALGCVLYEMLVGRPPFDGETTSEVLGRILRGTPDPMPPLGQSVAPLVDVITTLLEKRPERRLRPNELIQRLRSWERHEGKRTARVRLNRRARVSLIASTALVAAVVGAVIGIRSRETPPPPVSAPSLLVRVADVPSDQGPVLREIIGLSSRDALFAYFDFIGRERDGFKRIDERTVSIEGPTAFVRTRTEQARIIDQLFGYEFFGEPNRFTGKESSSRLVSCDLDAIQPSELVALFSAAAGWPVVQSADAPLEDSAYLRVSADRQPWDDVVLRALRAAGLSEYRYESTWLVTAETVSVAPRLKTLIVFPGRSGTEVVIRTASTAASSSAVAWTVVTAGREGVVVVDDTGGVESLLESLAKVRGPDWELIYPPRFTDHPISLRLENAPLEDVLDFFGNLGRRPYRLVSPTRAWVRASIVDIPADEPLAAVLDANGLTTRPSEAEVVVEPFGTESVEIRLQNATGSVFEPLREISDRATGLTGVATLLSVKRGVVRVEGRNDVVRDLASIVRTIDLAMKP